MSYEVSTDELRKAIRHNFGCDSRFVESVPVVETWQGAVAWQGVVNVFDLIGHPAATRAYAWSHEVDASTKRRFVTVLHEGPVRSASNAVRAAVSAEHKGK